MGTVPRRFKNSGREIIMLHPRRDLELLTPADAFCCNLARATVQMLSTIALLAASAFIVRRKPLAENS